MPEGDSYTRARQRLEPILVGRTVDAVEGAAEVRAQAGRLIGHEITGVRTNGKHLLVDFDNDWSIHVWLGMPGRVAVAESGGHRFTEGRDRRERSLTDEGAVRLRITTAAGQALVYGAPVVEVERRRVIDASLERLGPDVLADGFDWELFDARASQVDPARAVVDVLLDQRVMAGVGNEYKNEILFLERIHPLRRFEGVADPRRLADRAITLMTPNARRGTRITTGDPGRGRESWVYGRGGKPCRRCRTAIEVAHLGDPHARITYWCPRCQSD